PALVEVHAGKIGGPLGDRIGAAADVDQVARARRVDRPLQGREWAVDRAGVRVVAVGRDVVVAPFAAAWLAAGPCGASAGRAARRGAPGPASWRSAASGHAAARHAPGRARAADAAWSSAGPRGAAARRAGAASAAWRSAGPRGAARTAGRTR